MISQKLNPAFFLEYLAINTTWSHFLLITYIIKMKRANPVKWICLYWKTISQIFSTSDIYTFIAQVEQ